MQHPKQPVLTSKQVPLPRSQKRAILHLIRGLIKSMSIASTDPRHPAARNAAALDRLLRRIHPDQSDLQTPFGITRASTPRAHVNAGAPEADNPLPTPFPASDAFLPTVLGESPFVAERPLQALAADIDALLGVEADAADISAPLFPAPVPNSNNLLPPADMFASLFNYDDLDFWEAFNHAPMNME
jgi:hypothetical protein